MQSNVRIFSTPKLCRTARVLCYSARTYTSPVNYYSAFILINRLYTVAHKNTCHYIFDYKSRSSWWIFFLHFLYQRKQNSRRSSGKELHTHCWILTEERRTKKKYSIISLFNGLMTSQLRHASMFTLSSYFVRNNNTMKSNMSSSEDKILIKTCSNVRDFLPEDSSRNYEFPNKNRKNKHLIWRLSATVAHKQFRQTIDVREQIFQTHCRKRSVTVIPNCR